ncbi:uncharacterized protein LOC127644220 [Xyrauchen texanus]|uniref:uncharacterized protein LOC127644220 n=1 Tax=Xyrauchen texanus TaxID=154827 RepID=UPI00224204C4|nr:uncharacterized protein LOC127644220 [Xyrauchen texanus]
MLIEHSWRESPLCICSGEQNSGIWVVVAVLGSTRPSGGVPSSANFIICSRSCAWMTAAFSGTSACPAPSLMTCCPASERGYRRSIPAVERLSICLRFLATGDSFRTIASSFRVGVSTVSQIVHQVVTAIWDCLVEQYMAVPTTDDWRSIAEGFQERWNYPLCCPPERRVFNYRLSRARLVVENAFGILSSQWRMYRRLIEVHPEVAEKCVKATCLLHNFLRCSEGREAPAARGAGHAGEEPLPGLGRVAANNSSREALRVRDVFMAHFSAEGAVPWQPTE